MREINSPLFLLLISFLIELKPVLFWTYLWQLKEYRLDRFRSSFGWQKILRFYLFNGGRQFHYPKWTLKSILIIVSSLGSGLLIGLMLIQSRISLFWLEILTVILVYFTAPILVAVFVFIFRWPSILIKQFIYLLARKKISEIKNILVIGITGSYGKTSTKEILSQILSQKFTVISTPGNINTEIGLSKFILKNSKLSHKTKPDSSQPLIFIAEMGAYRVGEIKKICQMVRPQIGILTGLCPQHLSLFGSFEKIKQAKMELIKSLPPNGLAVFNGDDENIRPIAQKYSRKKIIYSAAQVKEFNFPWPEYYRTNLSGAINIAKYLDIKPSEIQESINNLYPTNQIAQLKKGKNGTIIIDDSYNINPTGAIANLNYLATFSNKRRIIVLPCLIELGNKSADIHYQIGQKIAQVCQKAIVTNLECAAAIKAGAESINPKINRKVSNQKIIFTSNLKRVTKLLKDELGSQTVILIEGRIPKKIKEFLIPKISHNKS